MPTTTKATAISFTAAALAFFVISLFAYFSAINFWLAAEHSKIPTSFKELLLRKTEGPRIIVDSGSNSFYAIDPLILERAFKMPAINLADNVGYPLRHKFHYLVRYTRPGDIVVLPLEWVNFVHKPVFDNYILPVLNGSLSYYYQSLPLKERLKFAFQNVPVKTFLQASLDRFEQAIDPDYHRNNLERYKSRLSLQHGNSLGSGLNPDKLGATGELTINKSCDEALFGSFQIGPQFVHDIQIMKATSNKGVKVIFTWPAAVDKEGNGCYKSDRVINHLDEYEKKLRTVIGENGFIVAGEPMDSVFSSDFMHNTYYHITEPASKVRTERLAQRLMEAGVTPADTGYLPGDSIRQLGTEVTRLLEMQTSMPE